MASLNLSNWRTPGLRLLIRRQYRQLLLFSLISAVLVAGYYHAYKPRLTRVQQQWAQLAAELIRFDDVAARVQSLEQQMTIAAAQRALQQQHADVLADFTTLLTLTSQGIQISAIHWLHRELSIRGNFLQAEDVRALEQQLDQMLDNPVITVQFRAPRQFIMLVTFETMV